MQWVNTIFYLAVAFPSTTAIKYSGLIILKQIAHNRLLKSMIHVIKRDTRDEITL